MDGITALFVGGPLDTELRALPYSIATLKLPMFRIETARERVDRASKAPDGPMIPPYEVYHYFPYPHNDDLHLYIHESITYQTALKMLYHRYTRKVDCETPVLRDNDERLISLTT